MIRSLRLQNFKNFRDATLNLGPFTVIVGTNASGKSNIRDAFRFLHGMSRGYTLAEIIGEKWVEGGSLQWKGIRGGTREIIQHGKNSCAIDTVIQSPLVHIQRRSPPRYSFPLIHHIRIESRGNGAIGIIDESLATESGTSIYVAECHEIQGRTSRINELDVRIGTQAKAISFSANQPIFSQLLQKRSEEWFEEADVVGDADHFLLTIRFLDLDPVIMRNPSLPGSSFLGDRGENLSSVLLEICEDAANKSALMEWLKQLTPLDVVDFEFIPDQQGKVLVTLVESDGKKTSAYSASDGTLRFLAVIAALLAPTAAKFYFFEEIDNGIHPTRLHLLLQLIEQQVAQRGIQVVATTHSPQLLAYLNEESRQHAALVYRNEGEHEGHITSIVDIPGIQEVLASNDLGKLMATGWLEDAVAFMADGAVS